MIRLVHTKSCTRCFLPKMLNIEANEKDIMTNKSKIDDSGMIELAT